MSKKIITFDRNKASGPMTGFMMVPSSPEAIEEGVISTFHNNKYIVFIKKLLSREFAIPDESGNLQPMEIIHLIVARKDKKKIEIPWEEKQTIKNEILGPMSECVEMFPSEFRRIGKIADYQTHLWGFPPGFTIPIGLFPKAIQSLAKEQALNNFSITMDELEVFVVEDDGVSQIFASKSDACESYEKSGNEMPKGEVCRIGYIDSDNVVWSEMANEKRTRMFEKALHLAMSIGNDKENNDENNDNDNPDRSATDILLSYMDEKREKEENKEREEMEAEISLDEMREKLKKGELFKKE